MTADLSTIRRRLSPASAEEPSELSRLPSSVHNGSAQLSYFIYSCTARNPTPSPHHSKRRHARVNLRPSVLCIRSTMSNSQRTSQRLEAFSRSQFRLSRRGQNCPREHCPGRTPPRGTGGAERDRTDDLLLAKQALSQLSYGPNLLVHHTQHGRAPRTQSGGPGKI